MYESYLRGHKIILVDQWRFADTMEPTINTWKHKSCGFCNRHVTLEGHDSCLGTLPGIRNACCGHGELQRAYVQFDDGVCIRGLAATMFIKEIKRTMK